MLKMMFNVFYFMIQNESIDCILVALANINGPLKTYDANVCEADTTLLWAGNHSFVPSIDAIRTAKSNYNKDHRFDNDPIKDVDIFRYALIAGDVFSTKIKGMVNRSSSEFYVAFVVLYA